MDGAFWLAMINGTVASASATVTADSAQARRTAIPVRRGARIDGILGIRRPRIVTAVSQVALGGPQMPPLRLRSICLSRFFMRRRLGALFLFPIPHRRELRHRVASPRLNLERGRSGLADVK